ncbi:MAG: amidohydrolase family protein [Alphaproteobacteria bacterium]|nr:amidohydrolase family protein [Alphaproteobacteria bacterium]
MTAMFDADTHVREGYFLDEVYALSGEFAKYSPKRIKGGAYHEVAFEHDLEPWGKEVEKFGGHRQLYGPDRQGGRIAEMQPGGHDREKRINDLASAGVGKQVLFCTGSAIPTLNEGPLGLALCEAYNDWIAGFVKGYEDQLYATAVMPGGYPEGMAGELRRAATELGIRAAHITGFSLTRCADDPAFDDFYATAEALEIPLFVHPASRGPLANRHKNFWQMHALARPTMAADTLVSFVIGGVFEKFPKLKVTFFECSAAWMLYWMDRMDMGHGYLNQDYAPQLTLKPSDYVRRNCWLTVESNEKCLPEAFEEIGEDRLMMSSDYPHWDCGFPGCAEEAATRTDLTAAQRERLTRANIADLLKVA